MKPLKVIFMLLSVIAGSYSKTIFVQPTFRPICPRGFAPDSSGSCIEIIEIDRADYEFFLIAKISSVDYEDDYDSDELQSDQPTPDESPSKHLNLGPEVMEDDVNFSMIMKRKRSSLSMAGSITTENIIPSKENNTDFVSIVESTTEVINSSTLERNSEKNSTRLEDEIPGKINVTSNQDVSKKKVIVKNYQHNLGNHIPKYVLMLPLTNEMLRKAETSADPKVVLELSDNEIKTGSDRLTIPLPSVTSNRENQTTHSSSPPDNSFQSSKNANDFRKWRHFKIFGELKKVLASRKHKNKT